MLGRQRKSFLDFPTYSFTWNQTQPLYPKYVPKNAHWPSTLHSQNRTPFNPHKNAASKATARTAQCSKYWLLQIFGLPDLASVKLHWQRTWQLHLCVWKEGGISAYLICVENNRKIAHPNPLISSSSPILHQEVLVCYDPGKNST